jgi:hypothetical protein
MNKFVKPVLALILPAAMLVSSCKKENLNVNPKSTNKGDSVQFYATVDNDMNSVDEAIDEVLDESGNARKGSSCYTVTFSSDTTSPVPGYEINYRKIVLTFTGTCDSLNRTGQIIVYKSGSWITGNYKDSIIFSGFSTDGRSITGYRTRSISKSSDLKNLVFTFSNNIQITTATGQTISYQSTGKRVIVNYLLPLLKSIEITGSGLFINANGDQVSYAITNPVILNGACQRKYRYPVQGTITYTNTAANYTSTVDYGNGTCDRIATISVNGGAPVTFKLK